jgi:hypothetical protein
MRVPMLHKKGRAQDEQVNFIVIKEGIFVCWLMLMMLIYLGWLVVSILVWIREGERCFSFLFFSFFFHAQTNFCVQNYK